MLVLGIAMRLFAENGDGHGAFRLPVYLSEAIAEDAGRKQRAPT